MNIRLLLTVVLCTANMVMFSGCASESDKQERGGQPEDFEEIAQIRFEQEESRREQERVQRELERLRIAEQEKLREENNLYRNNRLATGALPYADCYGRNSNCSNYNCSEITVKASYDSDCLVTIKKDGKVVRHAYIEKGRTYTFEVPDGIYQPFFYSGNGWNPNKLMPSSSCDTMRGGFISDVSTGKDDPQQLNGHILSYELVSQVNGNFSTRPSSPEEAF